MIERIIAASIRRRGLVILASLLLAVAGVLAIRETPVDAIPDLSEDAVLVFADWPGHSPREVEDQVTYPLALGLQGLAGVRAVRSSSDFNFALIHVILDDSLGVAEGRRRVAERLSRVGGGFPNGVIPRLGPDSPATGQILWYTVEGKGLDPGRLRAVQDWYVKPRLASVPGVAEVASVGGFPIEYQVAIVPDRLRARGVTLGEVVEAIGRSNATVGGHAIQKGNAEYLVRGVGRLGDSAEGGDAATAIVRDLEAVLIPGPGGEPIRVGDVATIAVGPGPRRGVLEKDGGEAVGGVVLMASGENPLVVTRRIKEQIHELSPGLPRGVSIVPFHDRTPLIEGAIGTVRGALVEAIVGASICVLVVLLHARASVVVAVTLPLAVLGSFAIMAGLRRLGVVDIQANIMSLSGIAISIGVLVDSSVVMVENVLHRLRERFGDEPARGDLRSIILPACVEVGRPIFFSVVIMLLSFLPVFALGGSEGKMFRPLAFTKTFALLTVAGLAITLVPALCSILLRGRIRGEQDSPLVRGVAEVYRPTLAYLLGHPGPLAWVLGTTFLVGFAPIGSRPLLLATLFAAIVAAWMTARSRAGRVSGAAWLVVVALGAESWMTPIARESLTPLDEGMAMDMPITVPRASVTQSAGDLMARDMVFCRFPEVDMVVGKAGRADTPTDPAPMDMIETMVNFRPRDLWPRRARRPSPGWPRTRRDGAMEVDPASGRLGGRDRILPGRRRAPVRRPDARICLPPQRRIPPRPRGRDGPGLARRPHAPASRPLARARPGDRGRAEASPGGGRRGGRPDPRQGLPRNPRRSREGRAARRRHRRPDRRDRDGDRRSGRDDHRRGPRASRRPCPIRPGLPRGRGVRPRDPRPDPAPRPRRPPPIRPDGRGGRRPDRRGPRDDQGGKRRPPNYVRLNVRGRGVVDFVEEARKAGARVALPPGVSIAWTGQFEHEARARRTLAIVLPLVIGLILSVLYWTYRDLGDALTMLVAVPGSIAGGVAFQWWMGFPFTLTSWVGYIACFGMATSTGIIMLVYLRDGVERAGGLEALDEAGLRAAVIRGAAHRLRPKLLTEGITILGLAPMLWADGPGAEVIRPMVAPVLGGLLVADEVIDLLLPVLFYQVRGRRLDALRSRAPGVVSGALARIAVG